MVQVVWLDCAEGGEGLGIAVLVVMRVVEGDLLLVV